MNSLEAVRSLVKEVLEAKSYSMFYGPAPRANQFPSHSDTDLHRDLSSPSIDDDTRKRIEAELTRRAEA
jgi:hypothetical protein